uniref:Uncharacterized protein n=1 Tax=Globisporangium ultimum (strain ATCC 200006 / CBS 805.95 / DAOM BR144) TaxID=431595 RepID=K3W9H2_GLOUD
AKLDLAWQRIAKNQLAYRRQSEAENRFLKSELRHAIHMAQRALTKLQDADGFTELITDVDASFARLDDVFQERGIDQIASDVRHYECIKNDFSKGCQCFELTNVSIKPFDSRMTTGKLWKTLLTLLIVQAESSTELIWKTDDGFAINYHSERPIGENLPPSKVVMKRYTCPGDRFVVVWRACTELNGSLLGTVADETG